MITFAARAKVKKGKATRPETEVGYMTRDGLSGLDTEQQHSELGFHLLYCMNAQSFNLNQTTPPVIPRSSANFVTCPWPRATTQQSGDFYGSCSFD